MSNSVAIPYYSGSGHTKKLAEFIAQGIKREDNFEVSLIDVCEIEDIDWSVFYNADAIIFGSPTYMGGLAGRVKTFMDETSKFWVAQKWNDKISGGFTVGTSPSGDKLQSLVQMSVFAAQHGMIWVGQQHVGSKHTDDGLDINEPGSWLGLMAQSSEDKTKLITDQDERTAILFGERIAQSVLRWKNS